jgi:hypothetical protein
MNFIFFVRLSAGGYFVQGYKNRMLAVRAFSLDDVNRDTTE